MQSIIETLRQHFPNLFAGNGLSSGVEIVAVAIVVALLYFIFFVKKSYKNPFWAIIVTAIGVGVFLGFLYSGIYLGRMFGYGYVGAFIGIAAFFFLATVYKYYSTPKDQRRARFM